MCRSRLPGTAALAIFAWVAGCAPAQPLAPVTGAVTLDGNPVGDGGDAVIRFDPADGKGNSAESFVTAGKYSVRLVPGAYKVSITWGKKAGKPRQGVSGPGAGAEASEQVIPAKYNTRTELSLEVKPGTNEKDWDLKTK